MLNLYKIFYFVKVWMFKSFYLSAFPLFAVLPQGIWFVWKFAIDIQIASLLFSNRKVKSRLKTYAIFISKRTHDSTFASGYIFLTTFFKNIIFHGHCNKYKCSTWLSSKQTIVRHLLRPLQDDKCFGHLKTFRKRQIKMFFKLLFF